jgi:hypothetical protein
MNWETESRNIIAKYLNSELIPKIGMDPIICCGWQHEAFSPLITTASEQRRVLVESTCWIANLRQKFHSFSSDSEEFSSLKGYIEGDTKIRRRRTQLVHVGMPDVATC